MSPVDIKAKQASIFLERERSNCFGKLVGITMLVTVVLTGNGWAQGEMLKDKGGRRPLAELLNQDGTVNVSSGYRGAIDPRGLQMVDSPQSATQFAPFNTAGDEGWSDEFGVSGQGLNNSVSCLALDGAGNLYAGGYFTQAGGVSANRVAKWNGTSWSPLGSGMNDFVHALALDSARNLYAGGDFTQAGAVSINYIAKWNGTSWSPLGSGMNLFVYALALDGAGNLYAGGKFTQAGVVSANYIAKWDGTSWSPLGSGMNGAVSALAMDGAGNLYAGGWFTQAGGVSTDSIAKWNGTSWSTLSTGINTYTVAALAVDRAGNLYAGGYTFSHGNVVNPNYIVKWNGTSWSRLGSQIAFIIYALAVDGAGNLYAGGIIYQVGGVSVRNIAKWNGTSWSPLGSGMNDGVYALAVDGAGNLYAGGWFTQAGGKSSSYIARWNGQSSSPPGKATLVSPSGSISTSTPAYTWNAVSSATWYYLWVNDSTAAGKIKTWYTAAQGGCASGTGTCSVTPSTALAAGSSQWWIQTWNNAGYGPWSDPMTLVVVLGQPPGKATLISPAGTITSNTPTYTWNAVQGSTYYYLWVNDSSFFSDKIRIWYTATDAGCVSGGGTCSVTPSTALAAGSSQWWIQTWNANGHGPWSDGMTFTVGGAGPPGKATLVSPSGSIATATPTFVWNAVPGATWYRLWVNDNAASLGKIKTWYTAAQAGCDSGAGICSVTPTATLANGNAQWWILTWNDAGYGPWSDGMSFTVAPASGPGQ